MKNLKWLFFLVLSLGTFVVYGQSGTVRGVVIDDATGETIIGGTVVVQDLGTGTVNRPGRPIFSFPGRRILHYSSLLHRLRHDYRLKR
jgi:hypothetical protein